jgi:hypothetical protein
MDESPVRIHPTIAIADLQWQQEEEEKEEEEVLELSSGLSVWAKRGTTIPFQMPLLLFGGHMAQHTNQVGAGTRGRPVLLPAPERLMNAHLLPLGVVFASDPEKALFRFVVGAGPQWVCVWAAAAP